jgi:hypothetical protein
MRCGVSSFTAKVRPDTPHSLRGFAAIATAAVPGAAVGSPGHLVCFTDPATLWNRYIHLTDAEWAFGITKDELKSRPSGSIDEMVPV